MSTTHTDPFDTLHHSLSQILPDYDSDNSPSSSGSSETSQLQPRFPSPSSAPRNNAPPPAQQTGQAPSSQSPNKESLFKHTSHPATPCSSTPSQEGIHALLLNMGNVQESMRASIANLEAITARALSDTTAPPQNNDAHATHHAADDSQSAQDSTTAQSHATQRARDTRDLHASEETTRLECENARLEQENVALRTEVETLKKMNRQLRTEWRRNAMLQGLRWVGRDF